ncbi:MAG TPA: sulfatase-like hydrolase/transferase [Bryobacteraceae bacterium]|nr:sulfatase-like hydrolase/transferase [Bryobacteraceae bacterium]
MNRRAFLSHAAAAASVFAANRKRPNILWLSCEDSSPQFGCYGDRNAITPTVDALAAKGVRYTRVHSVAGVCAPSRSGIITGMYPTTLGSQYMRCSVALPDFVKCFPEYLRESGYYCTNNAKTDYNFPVPQNAWDEVSRQAHWKNRKKDQPFFAVFNFETTHESQCRKRGAEYSQMIQRLTPQQRQDAQKLDLPPYYPDTPESRRDWAQVYELITAMDYQVSDRLKELEQAGLLEDTIVFFWGDHGVGLPRAKRWCYESSTHVPLVVSVPEQFRTTAQSKPGTTDDQLISLIDLGPTVLNLAGVKIPDHMHGRAFLGPNLRSKREYVFAARDRMDERYDSVRMVRDGRYRYLHNFTSHLPYAQHTAYMEMGNIMNELRKAQAEGKLPEAAKLFMGENKPVEELYDTENDTHELKNLASLPEHKKTLERMRNAQLKWALETRDTGLIPEPDLEERGKQAGNRYSVLHQSGSEKYLRDLWAFADSVNRNPDQQILRRSLTNLDPAFRYWSIIGLTKTTASANAAKQDILKATADPDPSVRIAALRAAALHLGDDSAIPKLASEMTSANVYVRLHAAQALDALGGRAAPAKPALQTALKDESEYVKRIAEHAISALSAA